MNKNKKELISIVVPCWNCSKTIRRLLDSVLAQNMDKEEIVSQLDSFTSNIFI